MMNVAVAGVVGFCEGTGCELPHKLLTVSQRRIPHPTSIGGDTLRELLADVELEIGMVL
jgi:hypothetical protein